MNSFEILSLNKIKLISLDSIEIDVSSINETRILLNGFFPELIEKILNTSDKEILFFSESYVRMAQNNWPICKGRFGVYSPKLDCRNDFDDFETYDTVIYEGHVNSFSGIDISSFLMRSLVESKVISNAYFVCHPEARLNPPIRYTNDFDQHLHDDRIPWEEFFVNCTNWVPRKNVLTVGEVEKIKFKKPLIINCSTSYHQPIMDFTTNLLSKGCKGFFSDRNVHPQLFQKCNAKTFIAENLLNYSPFEPDSVFSRSIKNGLKEQLGEFLNVKLD